MSLGLPGEALSIPVIRRVLGDALQTLGVDGGCVDDIQVAVTEACTNVLDHAGTDDSYEVDTVVGRTSCVLRITDRGIGIDTTEMDRLFAPATREGRSVRAIEQTNVGRGTETSPDDVWSEAEHGRGIQLMRALVDDVSFGTIPGRGTVVYLQKQLTWKSAAPAGMAPRVGV